MAEMPSRIMIDADVHSFIKQDMNFLFSIAETNIELHLSTKQDSEIRAGLDECPEWKADEVRERIYLVEELAEPIIEDVETVGYGEVYGSAYSGNTGEIFEELTEPHPNIGTVHRPDAIGAEAAINREMPFVTGDRNLQDKMRECGYEEYLLTWSTFRKLVQTQID